MTARGVEKNGGKTPFRMRNIPLTLRLRELINQALQRSESEYVFTMEDGGMLNYTTIREDIWSKALASAELPQRKMYSLRHTFIGWMVLLGVNSTRLKNMAGHSSKSKLTEDTYGDFREGLLAERCKFWSTWGVTSWNRRSLRSRSRIFIWLKKV